MCPARRRSRPSDCNAGRDLDDPWEVTVSPSSTDPATWALDVAAPPRLLLVIESPHDPGEPPSLHLVLRLPLTATAEPTLAANGWQLTGLWLPRSFGRVARIAVRDGGAG